MVGIIDGDILMYRICWTVDPDALLYVIKHRVDEYMTALLDKVGVDSYIGILGIHGSNNIKYDIAPDYKRGRPADKPPHWNVVMNYLITKWGFVCVSGCETDDAIRLCVDESEKLHPIVISADKDLLQIPGDHFVMGVTRKGVVVKEDKFLVIDGQEAERRFYTQMLTGDSVDNVKGIKGIGPKTAEKILEQWTLTPTLREAVIEEYKKVFGETWNTYFMVNETLLRVNSDYARAVGFVCPTPIAYKQQYSY
jgi:DNA polymerase-1